MGNTDRASMKNNKGYLAESRQWALAEGRFIMGLVSRAMDTYKILASDAGWRQEEFIHIY